MTEIKVQRKAGSRKKWPWLLLLLIPALWFAFNKGGAPGDDEGKDGSDSTKAASTAPRTDSIKAKPADSTKKPPV